MCRPNRRQVNFTEGLVVESEVTYTPCNIVHEAWLMYAWRTTMHRYPGDERKLEIGARHLQTHEQCWCFCQLRSFLSSWELHAPPFPWPNLGTLLTSLVVYLVLFSSEGPGYRVSADPKIMLHNWVSSYRLLPGQISPVIVSWCCIVLKSSCLCYENHL